MHLVAELRIILDFALLGEKGRDGKFGISDEKLAR